MIGGGDRGVVRSDDRDRDLAEPARDVAVDDPIGEGIPALYSRAERLERRAGRKRDDPRFERQA